MDKNEQSSTASIKEHIREDLYYPLVNYTGAFSIAEYVYAISEGVLLYGIPDSYSVADGSNMCPYDFYKHDNNHTLDISVYVIPGMDRIQNVYREISSISDKKDRNFIMYIYWFSIHEQATIPFLNISTDKTFFRVYAHITEFEIDRFWDVSNDPYYNDSVFEDLYPDFIRLFPYAKFDQKEVKNKENKLYLAYGLYLLMKLQTFQEFLE